MLLKSQRSNGQHIRAHTNNHIHVLHPLQPVSYDLALHDLVAALVPVNRETLQI